MLKRLLSHSLLRLLGPRRFERLRYQYFLHCKPDAGYTRAYYQGIHDANHAACELFAEVLTEIFHPVCLVDVGCGNGDISAAFLARGCAEVFAFDGSKAAVAMARERGLRNVFLLDLIAAQAIPARGDLCLCLEVAEHLPEEHAEHLCKLLAEPAPILAFTAAPPGQGGHLHVNMQPRAYWIELLRREGMVYDDAAVAQARAGFAGRMIQDYDVNLMIFRRASA
jgi:SAM-dependent methyltransferase